MDPSAPPDFDGYAIVFEHMRQWRARAEEVTGASVRLNWFFRMDHQIERCYGSASALAERFPTFLDAMREHDDGIGLHPHAFRWSATDRSWYSAYDSDWLVENLHIGVRAFHDTFGSGPRLLRYGDGVLTNEVVDAAERAGVRFDLTLEPGRPTRPLSEPGEYANGLLPDWTQGASRAIRSRPAGLPTTASSRQPRHLHVPAHVGIALARALGAVPAPEPSGANTFRYRNQRDLLYMALPGWHGRDGFHEVLRRSLAAQRRPFLAFAIRTDWHLHKDRRRNIERCLHDLLAIQEERPLVFCTPEQALTTLRSSP